MLLPPVQPVDRNALIQSSLGDYRASLLPRIDLPEREKTYFTRRPKGFSNFHKDMEVRPFAGTKQGRPRVAHERSKSVMSYAERPVKGEKRPTSLLREPRDDKFSDRNLDSIIDRVLQRQEMGQDRGKQLERTESADVRIPLTVLR